MLILLEAVVRAYENPCTVFVGFSVPLKLIQNKKFHTFFSNTYPDKRAVLLTPSKTSRNENSKWSPKLSGDD